MDLHQLYSYFIHLATGLVLVGVFAMVYLRVTPFDEIALIRKGGIAAALSFGGTLVGFSLTVASGILHLSEYLYFLAWSATAMGVQLLAFIVLDRLIPDLRRELESNNAAMGTLVGSIALAIGLINGACLS